MSHTFEADARGYWIRVSLVIGMMIALGLLPLFVPINSDPAGFILTVHLIAVISFALLAYTRPRKLTLTIDETGVMIADHAHRLLISKSLSEVSDVSLGRWGHVLRFPIGWIILKETGRPKPRYFGAISRQGLDADTSRMVRECFQKQKANHQS